MDDQEMYEQRQQPPSVIPLSGYGEVECTHTNLYLRGRGAVFDRPSAYKKNSPKKLIRV